VGRGGKLVRRKGKVSARERGMVVIGEAGRAKGGEAWEEGKSGLLFHLTCGVRRMTRRHLQGGPKSKPLSRIIIKSY